ncbi:unnamed protein product, partial [Mesorhabditis spiculigera]
MRARDYEFGHRKGGCPEGLLNVSHTAIMEERPLMVTASGGKPPYSRSFSTNYVHPGSETDSEERPAPRYRPNVDKKLFISSITAKHAGLAAACANAFQIFANFFIFLRGCGVTSGDMLMGIIPVVFGFITIGLFLYAILSNFSYSVRPFIVHQITAIVIVAVVLMLFLYSLFQLQSISGIFQFSWLRTKMLMFLEPLSTAQRAGFALFLLVNISISALSLHVAIILHSYLENCVKVVSNDVTEV